MLLLYSQDIYFWNFKRYIWRGLNYVFEMWLYNKNIMAHAFYT